MPRQPAQRVLLALWPLFLAADAGSDLAAGVRRADVTNRAVKPRPDSSSDAHAPEALIVTVCRFETNAYRVEPKALRVPAETFDLPIFGECTARYLGTCLAEVPPC